MNEKREWNIWSEMRLSGKVRILPLFKKARCPFPSETIEEKGRKFARNSLPFQLLAFASVSSSMVAVANRSYARGDATFRREELRDRKSRVF